MKLFHCAKVRASDDETTAVDWQLLFATTRSVVMSVKVSVAEIAKRTNCTGFGHRSSGDKSVGCVVQANICLTSCGEAPQYVQMSLGSPNTLCL